uniref:Uncharacterized protein n=1 Tax=Zea mays TaxID=4577 RepID=B6SND4_MAIZE|nr:hypothetical protein [Zea mays]
MCGGAILAELIPARVHRPLTAATLWAAALSGTTTVGKWKADAAAATDDDDDEEFEAEFQLFDDDDECEAEFQLLDDHQPSPAASPEASGCKRKPALAPPADMASTKTQSTLARVKELIAQGPHDERLAARIVPELMMHGSRDEAAALIAEFSRQMEEIAALRRDLETRERQLVQLVSLVLR